MSTYKKCMGAILAKDEEKFYILRNRELYNVNEIGARIFESCNGKNSIDDISNKLLKIFDIDEELLKKDIITYVEQLTQLELIKEV